MTRERLIELMTKAKVEQKDLSEATGMSEATISRYITGSRSFDDAFGTEAEAYLLGRIRDMLRDLRETAGLSS